MNDFSQPQNSQSSFGTMKNGTKIGPKQPAHGARNQSEGDDRQRQRLRQGNEQQHRPVDQVRQNRPRVRLQKCSDSSSKCR